jgi:hypothetical protein
MCEWPPMDGALPPPADECLVADFDLLSFVAQIMSV